MKSKLRNFYIHTNGLFHTKTDREFNNLMQKKIWNKQIILKYIE